MVRHQIAGSTSTRNISPISRNAAPARQRPSYAGHGPAILAPVDLAVWRPKMSLDAGCHPARTLRPPRRLTIALDRLAAMISCIRGQSSVLRPGVGDQEHHASDHRRTGELKRRSVRSRQWTAHRTGASPAWPHRSSRLLLGHADRRPSTWTGPRLGPAGSRSGMSSPPTPANSPLTCINSGC